MTGMDYLAEAAACIRAAERAAQAAYEQAKGARERWVAAGMGR